MARIRGRLNNLRPHKLVPQIRILPKKYSNFRFGSLPSSKLKCKLMSKLMCCFPLDDPTIDPNEVRKAKTFETNGQLLTMNKVPKVLTSSLSTINIYELDHRLVERRMRNGFHDFLHGTIKDDLNISLSVEQLFELSQQSCVTPIRPSQPSLFTRIKKSIGKFLRRGLCCVGAREEASVEIIFHAY